MLVRQLIGINAGKIADFPYHIARQGLDAQPPIMCIPGEEPKVRGMVLEPMPVMAAPVAPKVEKAKVKRAKVKTLRPSFRA